MIYDMLIMIACAHEMS